MYPNILMSSTLSKVLEKSYIYKLISSTGAGISLYKVFSGVM